MTNVMKKNKQKYTGIVLTVVNTKHHYVIEPDGRTGMLTVMIDVHLNLPYATMKYGKEHIVFVKKHVVHIPHTE